MAFGSIYKIEFPNGKVYIGQTSRTLEQRKKEHKRDAKKGVPYYVYNELRCHNMVDTFELIEIDTADTKEELDEKEKGYILMYKSLDREYGCNRTIGGDGVVGCVRTEENRKNNSEAQKKRLENPEEREKLSKRLKKYHLENPEERQRHSERQKKRYEDPEERQKLSKIMKKYYEETPGAREKQSETIKKYYEETPGAREKNSEAKKKYYDETPGAREKHSEAQKKRFENSKERLKNSERQKKRFEDPKERQRQSEATKKRFKNPEEKQKCSEGVKKYFETPGAKQKSLDARGKNKPFDIFTTDGTFVKSFTYQMDAREYLQNKYNITSIISIGEVLNGNRKSSAGFVFKYK